MFPASNWGQTSGIATHNRKIQEKSAQRNPGEGESGTNRSRRPQIDGSIRGGKLGKLAQIGNSDELDCPRARVRVPEQLPRALGLASHDQQRRGDPGLCPLSLQSLHCSVREKDFFFFLAKKIREREGGDVL